MIGDTALSAHLAGLAGPIINAKTESLLALASLLSLADLHIIVQAMLDARLAAEPRDLPLRQDLNTLAACREALMLHTPPPG